MVVCQVFMWFVVYSVLGWIWESAYCTAKERRWQNRGFLYGPACPIYGFGVVIALFVARTADAAGVDPVWWQVFLFSMVGSAVLEYATHWALEKLFHAYWWDYSDMPLNLNGRICLPASILFGLAGLLVVYVLYQPTVSITQGMSPLLIETLSLVFMAAMAADTAVTASALTQFRETASAINRSVNAHMDQFVEGVVERSEAAAGQLEAAKAQLAEAADELQARGEQRAAELAHEREAFAESLRESRVGEMSSAMLAAAKRVRGFSPSIPRPDLPNLSERFPGVDELPKLLEKVLGRR